MLERAADLMSHTREFQRVSSCGADRWDAARYTVNGRTVERLARSPNEEGEVMRIQTTFGDLFIMHVVKLARGDQVVCAYFDAERSSTAGMSFVHNGIEERPLGEASLVTHPLTATQCLGKVRNSIGMRRSDQWSRAPTR
jgi:hypothetical protein